MQGDQWRGSGAGKAESSRGFWPPRTSPSQGSGPGPAVRAPGQPILPSLRRLGLATL